MRIDGMLSRVADGLYWMSRYLERAEHTARMVDVHLNLMVDMAPGAVEQQRQARLLESLAVTMKDSSDDILKHLTFEMTNASSTIAAITTARENARQVREQISSEMWMQMNKLYLYIKNAHNDGSWQSLPHEFYREVKEGSHLFQGITDATMNHNQGWHFIQIGRYIERINGLLQLLDAHLRHTRLTMQKDISTDRYFEWVAILKSVTAFEAYCKVYTTQVQPMWMAEFLLFNSEFPRSLHFCVEMILASLSALADVTGRSKNTRLYRVAGRLQSKLAYDEIRDVTDLHHYLEDVKEQVYQIHVTLYDTYITYPIESAL